jgi:lysophospholipase L1-like esterase
MSRRLAAAVSLAGFVAADAALAAAPSCAGPATLVIAPPELAASRGALQERGGLTIVALGSSTTQGVGASAPMRAYPAQLAGMLQARLPGRSVDVHNKGVGGETVADNLRRLERDVLALGPDLVIWQVGTNDALRDIPPAQVRGELLAGLARLRAAGIDVVLMDPQPLTGDRDDDGVAMTTMLQATAAEAGIALVPRGALMRHWLGSGTFTVADLFVADRLHMSDTGYRCLAEQVADLVVVGLGLAAPADP